MSSNGNSLGNGKNGKNGKKRRRILWGAIAVVVLAGGGYGVKAALSPSRTIDPSQIASPERGDFARVVVATRKIQPLSKGEIKSKARRMRQKLYMDYGQPVQRAQARASLENAQEDLRTSPIVRPIDGLVLSRDVNIGGAVSSILVLGSQATLIMTLGDVSEVYVQGKVDEADIGKVFLSQPARIVVESFKDKKFTGKVTKISPLGKEKDNVTTFEVRVSISNPGGELKANMSANAEIMLEEKKNVLMIPEAALIYDKERKASVEIHDAKADNSKKTLSVKLGISNGVKTEILEGLGEKQQVILQ